MMRDHGDGLPLDAGGEPAVTNPAGDGRAVPLLHFPTTVQVKYVPTQSWNASHLQWNDGACDGFVRSIEQTIPGADPSAGMGYWTEDDLPFYHGLARTFPLATRWFCSCLGPTFPNRRFMIAGTANGLIDDMPFGMIDYPANGTIFDLLTAHRISWMNYHELARARVTWRRLSHAQGLNWLRVLGGVIAAFFPALGPKVMSKVQLTTDLFPLGLRRTSNHVRPVKDFLRAARVGRLPAVSFVDPNFKDCSEENPQDIRLGEAFAARIINAAMSGRNWSKTLLIWLYDEHGGFYDHVQPPAAPAPDDVPGVGSFERFWLLRLLRKTGFGQEAARADAGPATYGQLGFRVPAVIVSPYARPGYVTDTVYDHTSILKLIERKWNLPPLTRRDAWATDPLDALDLDSPPHFLVPPRLPEPSLARPAP
jgi:phospholipase C